MNLGASEYTRTCNFKIKLPTVSGKENPRYRFQSQTKYAFDIPASKTNSISSVALPMALYKYVL